MIDADELRSLTAADGEQWLDLAKDDLCRPRKDLLEEIWVFLTPSERRSAYGELRSIARDYARVLCRGDAGIDTKADLAQQFADVFARWEALYRRRSRPFELPADLEATIADRRPSRA